MLGKIGIVGGGNIGGVLLQELARRGLSAEYQLRPVLEGDREHPSPSHIVEILFNLVERQFQRLKYTVHCLIKFRFFHVIPPKCALFNDKRC